MELGTSEVIDFIIYNLRKKPPCMGFGTSNLTLITSKMALYNPRFDVQDPIYDVSNVKFDFKIPINDVSDAMDGVFI